MSPNTVGWIGCGRIARIMLGGWQQAGRMPTEVVVHDPDEAAVARLRQQFPIVTAADSGQVASQSRWLLLGVHPPQMAPVMADLRGKLGPETVVVSLAPKVTLAKLSDALGGWGRVARVLPNAASVIGAGYNPVAFGPGLSTDDRAGLVTLLAPLGPCPEVPEEQLEAYAVVTAMGPTYAWFQWQALEDLATRFGIPEDQVRPALRSMLAGALAVYFDSGLTPAEVADLIPVRPLQEHEAAVRTLLEEKLSAIYQKIKP